MRWGSGADTRVKSEKSTAVSVSPSPTFIITKHQLATDRRTRCVAVLCICCNPVEEQMRPSLLRGLAMFRLSQEARCFSDLRPLPFRWRTRTYFSYTCIISCTPMGPVPNISECTNWDKHRHSLRTRE
ncbi:hypothetical protein TRVL_00204 [Trypanosoma vivax]|nr:hypothetical protein TRVL_00204 [Trypanosoma vivax]